MRFCDKIESILSNGCLATRDYLCSCLLDGDVVPRTTVYDVLNKEMQIVKLSYNREGRGRPLIYFGLLKDFKYKCKSSVIELNIDPLIVAAFEEKQDITLCKSSIEQLMYLAVKSRGAALGLEELSQIISVEPNRVYPFIPNKGRLSRDMSVLLDNYFVELSPIYSLKFIKQ